MIPRVFVSSTIKDLHYLRDAVRDVIREVGYEPVMSEYGGVGYLGGASATESCYVSIHDCQIAILILGKRYGSIDKNGLSVTHNEFRSARGQGIPITCLVDAEVMTYMRIYNANEGDLSLPDMDEARKTFEFIQEIAEGPANNSVLAFSGVSEARSIIKSQLAHFMGDMLRRGRDPVTADVKDILTEIKTVRHDLSSTTEKKAPFFMRAVRFLLDQQNETYRAIVENLFGTLEDGVPALLDSPTFSVFVKKATDRDPGILHILTYAEAESFVQSHGKDYRFSSYGGRKHSPEDPSATLLAITRDRQHVLVNAKELAELEGLHRQFQRAVFGEEPPPGPESPTA